MKLELKHLAPYLPYNLKIKTNYGWDTVTTLNEYEVNGDHEHSYSYEDHPNEVLEFKPILRPLADLENDEYKNRIFNREYIIDKKTDTDLGYYEWCYLFENHFDVFGLIEKGLAIDINTTI